METKFRKALLLTVTNFSQKGYTVTSPPFSSGGCEWFIKGTRCDNYVSLYLSANEHQSLGLSWRRRANFYFVLLNQSGKETYRTPESGDQLFCAESPSLGFPKAFPLKELLESRVLINDRFIVEIYMKVVEVVDGYHMFSASLLTNKLLRCEQETVDVNGFHVLPSQVTSVKKIFVEHPDIALGFKSKNEVVKTEYMIVLLSLLETVKKPLKSISEIDLSNAHSKLCELTEVGFKLEWLKTELEEVSLEYKKVNSEGFQIQQLEEHVKNLEVTVSGLKLELDKEKEKATSENAKVLSFEKTLSDLKTELANEKTKSARGTAKFGVFRETFSVLKVELEKEKMKSNSAAAKVLSLEKELSDLKTEHAIEKAKSANYVSLKDAFSDLRVELEKEKAKSAKAFSMKETWSGSKVRKDHKKGNSENLLSWEDADLVSSTKCLGNGYKRIN